MAANWATKVARAAPNCGHDPPKADRIGAGRSLRQMAGELAGAYEHAAQWLRASVSRETERAEPGPELAHQE